MRTCVAAGNPKAGSRAPGPVQARANAIAIAEPGGETTMTDPAEHAAEISARPSSTAGFTVGAI
ncbi:hypothetical protein ACGFWF_16440 [Streptomyces sp. NPDC048581]|uniref:hypothetical protein n=1 Tax=Streptomyces sp. NPDC048581 TaxID=3365572 RepID=UPI00372223F7